MNNKRSCLAVYSAILFISTLTFGQSVGPAIRISVDSGRPLADALSQLETQVGVAINYEDVLYYYAPATDDVASTVVTANQRVVPKGGPLSFTYTRPPLANTLSIAPIVGALVEVSNSMDYTGAYEKSTVGGSLFVAPSQTRNVTGAFVPTTRPLDILVTLPFQERTAAETLDLILSQVSQGGKVQVAQGTVPFMMMATSKVLMVADKEPARSVLGRMFYLLASGPMADGSTVPRIGYQLLCDHISHNCALNIHIVGSTDARTAVPLSGSILAGWSPRKTN